MSTENKTNRSIKVKFYILSLIGVLILIGLFALGFLLNIFEEGLNEVPKYKLIIFCGCVVLSCIFANYYMNYALEHDKVLSKRRVK